MQEPPRSPVATTPATTPRGVSPAKHIGSVVVTTISGKTTSVDVHNGMPVKTLACTAWHQLSLPADDQPEARHSENWWNHKTDKLPDLALIDESGTPLSPSAAFYGFIEANRCLTLARSSANLRAFDRRQPTRPLIENNKYSTSLLRSKRLRTSRSYPWPKTLERRPLEIIGQ